MESVLVLVAIVTLVYTVFTFIEFYFGFNSLQNLSRQPIYPGRRPSVSIILSALNEEQDIEAVITNLMQLDYPELEIIAINDRSTDNTARILNSLKEKYPGLQVHHIAELPQGWLGKNHALYRGSRLAKGEWLLFTDADVMMKPDTLIRAMSYALANNLQYMTICERHIRHTFWLKVLLAAKYLTYSLSIKPWRIRYDWSKRSLGHGAFNLVQRSAYEAAGTHQAIALECLDDLKLGALLKKHGCSMDTVDGRDLIERQWYANLPDMIEGWKKNTYAYFDYRMPTLIFNTSFAVLLFLWPSLSLFFVSGLAFKLNVANVLLMMCAAAYVMRQFRVSPFYGLIYPVSIALILYTIWNSAFAIYRQKGVIWRGTHYPLELLRK